MNSWKLRLSILLLATTVACGGGGGGGGTGGSPTPVDASFTPDVASPTANTVAMAQGSGTGDVVYVKVTVTDISNLFGAAFEVAYDGTKVEYVSTSPGYQAGDALSAGGVTPIYQIGSGVPNRLVVSVARPGSAGATNVAGTKTLIAIPFRVLDPGTFRLDFQNYELYNAANPPQPLQGIGWKGGSLVGV